MPVSPVPSTIVILIDGDDLTRYVVFAQTRFDLVGTATPGTARIILRDSLRELHFITGAEVQLIVDDVLLWGGFVMDVARTHFFPVVDTADISQVRDRQWVLGCSDYNLWFDKRYLRDLNNLNFQNGFSEMPEGTVGEAVRYVAENYIDTPPGLTFNGVDADAYHPASPIIGQGKKWREQMDMFGEREGYSWYIDAAKDLQFRALKDLIAPFAFVDRNPNGVTSIGFREGTIREDGLQMVTDALVWGGKSSLVLSTTEEVPIGVIFARYPDPPANTELVSLGNGQVNTYTQATEQQAIDNQALYGRWQRGEMRIGDDAFASLPNVKSFAYNMIAGQTGTGATGIEQGLGRPVWGIALTWFAHDVPGKAHLRPDDLVNMVFYTMGEDLAHPLPLLLPLRSVSISFPTIPSVLPNDEPLTYVRFDGEFGISYSDSRYLWRFLQQKNRVSSPLWAEVNNDSPSTITGARGHFYPIEVSDGERVDFTLPRGYLAGSTEVYINGLHQRPRYEYIELSPGAGTIRFHVAPHEDDVIWIITRTTGA